LLLLDAVVVDLARRRPYATRMHISLNGEVRETLPAATIVVLIEQLQLEGKRLAVEVNEEVVPRSQYAQYRLSEGDRVEIVHAIGGG